MKKTARTAEILASDPGINTCVAGSTICNDQNGVEILQSSASLDCQLRLLYKSSKGVLFLAI